MFEQGRSGFISSACLPVYRTHWLEMGYIVPMTTTVNTSPLASVSIGTTMGMRALRDELVEQGVQVGALLLGTGVYSGWFDSPDVPLSTSQRVKLLRNASELAHSDGTGLRVGLRQRLSDFGVYGFGMASSETLEDALKFGLGQIDLAGKVLKVTQVREAGLLTLRSEGVEKLGSLVVFYSEFWRATMFTLLSICLGRRLPVKFMRFPYAEPAWSGDYAAAFGCQMSFDAPCLEIGIEQRVLDEPLPGATRSRAIVCASFLERIIGSLGGQSALEREIRLVLLSRLHQSPSAPEVATELGMSTRTFYRRLKDKGLIFQVLFDQIRFAIAQEMLAHTAVPVADIAFRTGFCDTSNFRRAFRRWTGTTPSQWREESAIH